MSLVASPVSRKKLLSSPSILLPPDSLVDKTSPTDNHGIDTKRRFSAFTSNEIKNKCVKNQKQGLSSLTIEPATHNKHSRSFSLNGTREKLLRSPELFPAKSSPSNDRPKSPGTTFLSPTISVGSSSPRRKSIGHPDSKLVVLGTPGVGKSAVVVRILTGRFIWEYDPTLEAIYRYNTTIDEEQCQIEILDTAGENENQVNEGHVRWGDGFLIVYSLTDRRSFLAVPEIHAFIANIKQSNNFPCILLANKSDLEHMFKVSREESIDLATKLDVTMFEASANEGSPSLREAIAELHREVTKSRGRRRRSSAKIVIEGFYKMFTR